MDAITLLTDEHAKMRKLLTELETTTERGVKTRQELFATIKGELTLHEVIEEEIFYPELKAHPKAEGHRPRGLRGAPRRRPAHGRARGAGRRATRPGARRPRS